MTFKLSARSRDKLSGVDERMAAVVHSAIHRTRSTSASSAGFAPSRSSASL